MYIYIYMPRVDPSCPTLGSGQRCPVRLSDSTLSFLQSNRRNSSLMYMRRASLTIAVH